MCLGGRLKHVTSTEQRWIGSLRGTTFDDDQDAGSGGLLGVTESQEAMGDAPPLHVHSREDETFLVVEGNYTFIVGDDRLPASPGSVVFAPRGIPHGYVVESPSARYICMITPGGFEGFFAEAGVPADAGFVPSPEEPDLDQLSSIAQRFGVDIVGPPPQ